MNVYYHSMGCTIWNYHIVNHTQDPSQTGPLTALAKPLSGKGVCFACSIFSNVQIAKKNLFVSQSILSFSLSSLLFPNEDQKENGEL